jgi:transposase
MSGFLGIDIAKLKFDVVLLAGNSKRHKVFDNTERGFAALADWLGAAAAGVHACMEATGGLGDELALFLHERGMVVSIVNPLQIKAFGQSELIRTKTDKVDAGVIARFCRSQSPAPWQPSSASVRELRALVRRCATLKEMRVQELHRQAQRTPCAEVKASLERMLAWLDGEIKTVSDAITALIRQDEAIRADHTLLVSIPGLAAPSAAILLAEIPDFRAFSHNKQITAFVGLDPRDHQSGSSVNRRAHISRIGNARVRAVLYMCALSARRHNPVLKAFADRLKENGKAPKAILVAVARKLLVIAYGVLKTRKPFQAA